MTKPEPLRATPTTDVQWDPPDGGQWALENNHGTSVVPITMRSQLESAFETGFQASFARFGMPISHIELRHVNDWPYTSAFVHQAPRSAGKPPPALALKLLTRLHPKSRARTKVAASALAGRTAQGFATEWTSERQEWIDRILAHQRIDHAALDDEALADHVEAGAQLGMEAMRRHFELVAGAIPFGQWMVSTNGWGIPAAEARAAVMHDTPVHNESATRLGRIAAAIDGAQPSTLDEVRAISPEASAALDAYLDYHGWWTTDDKISAPTIAAFPALVLHSIQAAGPTRTTPAAAVSDPLEKLRLGVPETERGEFDRRMADAHEAYKMLDDNSGILGSWAWGVAGRDFRAAAARLANAGLLDEADHVWALTADQVAARLRRDASPTAAQTAEGAARLAQNRGIEPPLHLNGEPAPPPDASVFPAPVAEFMAAIGAFLDDKFNAAGAIQGIGDHPVTGRAVVADSASDALDRIEPGDILVTTATTPAFNGVLGIVGGLVVSSGGPSSHAAVVARELGIPAIVGYAGATFTIPDGALITLDPVRAHVDLP